MVRTAFSRDSIARGTDASLGMNDVLPKPFTKDGLLNMLEKHLAHLKKQPAGLDPMGAPPPPQISSAKRTFKSEDSPITSPTAASNWNSPGNLAGISPSSTDDPYMGNNGYGAQHGGLYPHSQGGQSLGGGISQHRRAISDISGGAPEMSDPKRQMYGAPPHMAPLPNMQRPPQQR